MPYNLGWVGIEKESGTPHDGLIYAPQIGLIAYCKKVRLVCTECVCKPVYGMRLGHTAECGRWCYHNRLK